MTKTCAVCGGKIDMTFGSSDMRDLTVIQVTGDTAEVRIKYVCNYCRISFERVETLSLAQVREYSENQGFDR